MAEFTQVVGPYISNTLAKKMNSFFKNYYRDFGDKCRGYTSMDESDTHTHVERKVCFLGGKFEGVM